MRRLSSSLFGSLLVAIATFASAQESTGTVLVTTDVPSKCTITNGPSGPSPLVAKLAPGSWTVTCAADLSGVSVRRVAKVDVVAGQARKVALVLGSEK